MWLLLLYLSLAEVALGHAFKNETSVRNGLFITPNFLPSIEMASLDRVSLVDGLVEKLLDTPVLGVSTSWAWCMLLDQWCPDAEPTLELASLMLRMSVLRVPMVSWAICSACWKHIRFIFNAKRQVKDLENSSYLLIIFQCSAYRQTPSWCVQSTSNPAWAWVIRATAVSIRVWHHIFKLFAAVADAVSGWLDHWWQKMLLNLTFYKAQPAVNMPVA